MSEHHGGRAFIGSYTEAGGRGVVVADVAADTGALTERSATNALPQPSYLKLSDDASVLYAASETERGRAAAFRVGADATLAPLGEVRDLRADGPAHLTLAGGHLLVANYGSGSFTVLPVEADGALGEASSVFAHEGSGPNAERQEGPHAHQVLPDPSGRWVLGVDLGTDSVRVYRLDASAGTLAVHAETVLTRGRGPRHLAFHPDGRHAYVLHELHPSLTVCRWDAETGTLEALGEAPLLEEGTPGRDTSNASAIVVDRAGRFVWAANRGPDSISVVALDESHEKAELVTTVPCGGRWPRDLALDPAGRRLYAANEHSGDVTWFDVDPDTGVPVKAGAVEMPAASCVVFG
ncbi:lactonase family protein [Streptomyces fuscigenes]|uniref:lactonase family protein n=1 Tax=Streptomyces fuscigenes TaxID=1528880 RepID=UPI001F253201|nr:lactonase family protein [Streptomyces fuscigenes]MCF3963522.1 lactonase family protein [Streptomyces fuscigenes]